MIDYIEDTRQVDPRSPTISGNFLPTLFGSSHKPVALVQCRGKRDLLRIEAGLARYWGHPEPLVVRCGKLSSDYRQTHDYELSLRTGKGPPIYALVAGTESELECGLCATTYAQKVFQELAENARNKQISEANAREKSRRLEEAVIAKYMRPF